MCTNSENILLQRAGFGEINFGPMDRNLVKPCFHAFYFQFVSYFLQLGLNIQLLVTSGSLQFLEIIFPSTQSVVQTLLRTCSFKFIIEWKLFVEIRISPYPYPYPYTQYPYLNTDVHVSILIKLSVSVNGTVYSFVT